MQRTTPFLLGAAAALLLVLAYAALRPPSTEVPKTSAAPAEPGAEGVADGATTQPDAADAPARAPSRQAAGGPGDAWQPPPNLVRASARDEAPPPEFPELVGGPAHEPARSPEADAVAELVKETAVHVLTAVDPSLDPDEVTSWCTSDGTTCKLEGPWVGDDFGARWMSALGTGRLEREEYDNVVFQRFTPVEVDGEQRFEVVVRAQ